MEVMAKFQAWHFALWIIFSKQVLYVECICHIASISFKLLEV